MGLERYQRADTTSHNYKLHNCKGHQFKGQNCIGHSSKSYNCIGCNCIGHNCIGRNYMQAAPVSPASTAKAVMGSAMDNAETFAKMEAKFNKVLVY